MRTITLTQNQVAIIDDIDFSTINRYKWCAQKIVHTNGICYYAVRHQSKTEGGQTRYYMHREIIRAGDSKLQVDHINSNTLDNRRVNLRIVTHGQNQQNRNKSAGCSSQFKGVCWDKSTKMWRALIQNNAHCRSLGSFNSEIEAALAYNQAAIEQFGEYALVNYTGAGT